MTDKVIAETPLAQLRKLIDELDKEVHRIGVINTTENRERTLPELTVWSWLRRALALLTDLEAAQLKEENKEEDVTRVATGETMPATGSTAKAANGPSATLSLTQLLDHLESYDFECQGGPLKNCVDWHRIKAAVSEGEVAASRPAEPESQKVEIWQCLNGMENSVTFSQRRQFRERLERLIGVDGFLAASPAVEGGREEELRAEFERIWQHHGTVTQSTTWADVAELRAWYMQDVGELLAVLHGRATPQREETKDGVQSVASYPLDQIRELCREAGMSPESTMLDYLKSVFYALRNRPS